MNRSCVYTDHRRINRCTECNRTLDLCECENVEDLAARRLASNSGKFLNQIRAQVFLNEDHDTGDYANTFESLTQRLGELAELMIKHDRQAIGRVRSDDAGTTGEDILLAAQAVAVAAVRLATVRDPAHAYDPAEVFGDL